MKAYTVVGRGEECLRCAPTVDLSYEREGAGASSANVIDGMGKQKVVQHSYMGKSQRRDNCSRNQA